MALLATLPLGDWQFWVVTALACAAAFVVARMVLPPGLMPGRLRRRTGQRRATLTVGGKAVDPRRAPPNRADAAEADAKPEN